MTQPAVASVDGLGITVDRQGEDAVVRVNGRINVDTSPDLRDRLRSVLLEESPPRTVTIDLAGVPYIETSGAATLIEALKLARHRQAELRLRGLDGAVLRLFQVTGVLSLFEAGGHMEKVG